MLYSADRFRWRARAWHLTYKGHVPPELLLLLLSAATSVRTLCTSIVHEESDPEVPYPHTHFAWLWEKSVELHGAHIMDVQFESQLVHPHAEYRKSLKWLQGLFERYHHGFKADGNGRIRCIPPAAGPWQVLPAGFVWNDFIITEVSVASDLIEGAKIANVPIRSMHDVLLVQNAKRPAAFEHNFGRGSFFKLDLPVAFTSRSVGALQVWGAKNLGKTEWALAQFDNPLLVTEKNQLADFREGWHDGIVIDKLLPREVFTLHQCEALTDYMQPSAIKIMYKIARVPKRTPKIIVTNVRDAWPDDPDGILVGRRVAQLEIKAKTFGA